MAESITPKVAGIVLARLDSDRFPGKVLREVDGHPLVQYVIERARRIRGLDHLVIATTERPVDDRLAQYAEANEIELYRGAADDVALRILRCAQIVGCDFFVRLNGDSPFLDPDLISRGVDICKNQRNVDFVTNLVGRSYPYGIALEIVSVAAFSRAYEQMEDPRDREHVTTYLYDHLDEFACIAVRAESSVFSDARLVVDTEEDFNMFAAMVGELGDDASTKPHTEVARLYVALEAGRTSGSPVEHKHAAR